MAEFPALPLWTDAYIADTQHLTNEEHGVYLRLLMFAWRTPECALPDDDRRLAIMVGVTPKKWASLKPSVMAFWHLENGTWSQKKLTAGREFVERKRKQKSAAGKASSKAKSLKSKDAASTAVAEPLPTADATATQQSITITKTSEEKEEPNGSSKKRASRLPEDWQPDLAFAEREGVERADAIREADKFRDYWTAMPGQKGVKADWQATWRNWVRKAAADRAKQRPAKTGWRDDDIWAGVL